MKTKTLQAIKKSRNHWAKNYELAAKGKLTVDYIQEEDCALCEKFSKVNMDGYRICGDCPLDSYGMNCRYDDYSPYRNVCNSVLRCSTNTKIMEECANMVSVLYLLYEVYKNE